MREFLGLLLLVALVVKFWAWILAAALLWVVIKAGLLAAAEIRAQREEAARHTAALVARADREHALWTNGDDRGLYGQFPPADLP